MCIQPEGVSRILTGAQREDTDADTGIMLSDAIALLPPIQRRIIRMRLTDMTLREIGEAEGKVPSEILRYQRLAHENLKKIISKQDIF